MQPDTWYLQQMHLKEDRWSSPSACQLSCSHWKSIHIWLWAFVSLYTQLENNMNLRTCAQRNDNIELEDEKGSGGHLQAQAVLC